MAVKLLLCTFICYLFSAVVGEKVDCGLYNVLETACRDYVTGYGWTTWYCGSGYGCCEYGCCNTYGETFGKAELIGIILGSLALFTLTILTLLIIGATFCNDKADKSHLFGKKKSHH